MWFAKEHRMFWFLGGMCAVVLGEFLFLFVGFVPVHNVYLYTVEKNFEETVQHPYDSRLIKHFKKVHNVTNNGCDYLVAEFRATHLNGEDLQTWYKKRYPSYFENLAANPFIDINIIYKNQCAVEDDMCAMWLKTISAQADQNETIYLISFEDLTDQRRFDYRCM